MKTTSGVSAAEELFNTLTAELPDASPGKMFGALCMKMPNGKAGAMLWHDYLIVKLQGEPMSDALKLKGAKEFEPMEGRPMKGWVQIPYTHKNVWATYAKESVDGVRALPANAKAKPKAKTVKKK